MELASYFPVAGHQLLRADRPVQEVKHRPVRQRHIALRIYATQRGDHLGRSIVLNGFR